VAPRTLHERTLSAASVRWTFDLVIWGAILPTRVGSSANGLSSDGAVDGLGRSKQVLVLGGLPVVERRPDPGLPDSVTTT
jgi:hypothetical protein